MKCPKCGSGFTKGKVLGTVAFRQDDQQSVTYRQLFFDPRWLIQAGAHHCGNCGWLEVEMDTFSVLNKNSEVAGQLLKPAYDQSHDPKTDAQLVRPALETDEGE